MSEPTGFEQRLMDAIEHATEELERNYGVIFSSDNERRGFAFRKKSEFHKQWQRQKVCMVPCCNLVTITRSHTIQRSGPLSFVAEDGHVLYPSTSIDLMDISMQRCGIWIASTFPGFCEKHENIFSAFETSKRLGTIRHLALMCFRATCRELFRVRFELDYIQRMLADYDKYLEQHIRKALSDIATNFNLEFRGFGIRYIFEEMEKNSVEAIHRLENGLYSELWNGIQSDNITSPMHRVSTTERLSVCLTGIGDYKMRGSVDGASYEGSIVCCVLPNESATDVVFCSSKKDSIAQWHYVNKHISNDIDLLNQVESWMIYHTDHWFMTPSVWEALPTARQKIILKEMQSEKLLGVTPSASIFDTARRTALNELRRSDAYKTELGQGLEKFAAEEQKLS